VEESNQLHKGAKYGVNWRPKSKEELGRRATAITQAFKESVTKDGIYEILADIFGPGLAREFCRKEGCNYPLDPTDGYNNLLHTPGTHSGRATAPPPILKTSRPAPPRLQQPTLHGGQFITTPRGGVRAVEPFFTQRPLGQPTLLQGQFQAMSPGSIHAVEPNSLEKGQGYAKPSKAAGVSAPTVTSNARRVSTSPRRFTAAEKGKRKESPSPLENDRVHKAGRLV
jgi:hypothetical protein